MARTEHDEHWNGATIRVGTADRPVRGGAGVNTGRTPTVFLDHDLPSTPAISTNYELLKAFTFTDVDEAIDNTLANMYPYFYDPVDDSTTVIEADSVLEYALPSTWREIYKVEREILNSSPTRYRHLSPGEYLLREGPTTMVVILQYFPFTGVNLRFGARALPVLGTSDSASSIHPYQVVTPGALAYLYEKGGNPDAGNLSQRWVQEGQRQAAIFERRRREFHQNRETREGYYPLIRVSQN